MGCGVADTRCCACERLRGEARATLVFARVAAPEARGHAQKNETATCTGIGTRGSTVHQCNTRSRSLPSWAQTRWLEESADINQSINTKVHARGGHQAWINQRQEREGARAAPLSTGASTRPMLPRRPSTASRARPDLHVTPGHTYLSRLAGTRRRRATTSGISQRAGLRTADGAGGLIRLAVAWGGNAPPTARG